MTRENEMLALLESQEAEASAKAEWIAEWTATNRPLLLAGQLETDLSTLLAEVNHDQGLQLTKQLMDAALAAMAEEAWGCHTADLQTAMSEEQFERYLQRSAA